MQIFVTGSALETAKSLDRLRLNRQISEARILIEGIKGLNGWGKQTIAKMYSSDVEWLEAYKNTLQCWFKGDKEGAIRESYKADALTPSWFSEKFYNIHRSRLYTKDPIFYKKWSYLGRSFSNWYFINGSWKEVKQKH